MALYSLTDDVQLRDISSFSDLYSIFISPTCQLWLRQSESHECVTASFNTCTQPSSHEQSDCSSLNFSCAVLAVVTVTGHWLVAALQHEQCAINTNNVQSTQILQSNEALVRTAKDKRGKRKTLMNMITMILRSNLYLQT